MKNIATFRCYGNISLAKYYVPPLPFKNFLTRKFFCLHKWECLCADGQFCWRNSFICEQTVVSSRKRLGATNPIRSTMLVRSVPFLLSVFL